MSETQEQQWLIRKRRGGLESSIKILGPFWGVQVREMILSGALELEDEVCVENSYWIGLHEREEIKRALGVDPVARTARAGQQSDHETTLPDLESTDEIQTGVGEPPAAATERKGQEHSGAAHSKNGSGPLAFQRLKAPVTRQARDASPQFLGLEKGRYWGVLLVLITGAAVFGILWLIRILES